jgi:hypothetical protein
LHSRQLDFRPFHPGFCVQVAPNFSDTTGNATVRIAAFCRRQIRPPAARARLRSKNCCAHRANTLSRNSNTACTRTWLSSSDGLWHIPSIRYSFLCSPEFDNWRGRRALLLVDLYCAGTSAISLSITPLKRCISLERMICNSGYRRLHFFSQHLLWLECCCAASCEHDASEYRK